MLEAHFGTVPNDPFILNWTGVANVISFLQAARFFVEVVFAFSPQAEQAAERTHRPVVAAKWWQGPSPVCGS